MLHYSSADVDVSLHWLRYMFSTLRYIGTLISVGECGDVPVDSLNSQQVSYNLTPYSYETAY